MTIYDNASKVRAKKMHWMRGSCWSWWLIFTGAWADFTPSYNFLAQSMWASMVNMGFFQMCLNQCPNAPSIFLYKAM